MSEIAEKLIAENIKSKYHRLNLVGCGLNGTEEELYKPLRDAKHLKTLIFSRLWKEYCTEGQEQYWTTNNSDIYHDIPEVPLVKIPDTLPQNLRRLVLAADEDDNEETLLSKFTDLSALTELKYLGVLDLSYGSIEDISILENLKILRSLNLVGNPIKNIEILKSIKSLEGIRVDLENLAYPPIWYVNLKFKGRMLESYVNLPELPEVEKIWQIMQNGDKENINLAHQIALGQGWTEEEFEMYKYALT